MKIGVSLIGNKARVNTCIYVKALFNLLLFLRIKTDLKRIFGELTPKIFLVILSKNIHINEKPEGTIN